MATYNLLRTHTVVQNRVYGKTLHMTVSVRFGLNAPDAI